MTTLLSVLIYLLLSLSAVRLHPSRPRLPQCESSVIRKDEIDLKCTLTTGQFLDYNEIRTFTESGYGKQKFNVSIECISGGIVHLPWPFSAQNVISLQVSGCETVGFISEMFEHYPHPNELQQVSLVDIKHRVTIKELYNAFFLHSTIPQEYDCGLSKVVMQISRNIEYVFPPPSGSIDEMIMMEELLSSNSLDKLLAHNSMCIFPYLVYLEESGNTAMSQLRFKIMESNSRHPELQVYNLRNSSIPTVPEELRNLDLAFLPKLKVLDLSDNAVTQLNFIFKEKYPKSLLVDLSNNKVRSMNVKLVEDLKRSGNIIIDIRQNPLVCSCELFDYTKYLMSLHGNTAAREIYTGMTCELERRGLTEVHHVTETGLEGQLCPPQL